MFVQENGYGVVRGDAQMPVGLPADCRGRDYNIKHHKDQQHPGDHLSGPVGDALNEIGEKREHVL